MSNILEALPVGLRERPLDFYTAFVLFCVGVYGIVDDGFPENFTDSISSMLVNIISVYLIVASSLVISSLICKRDKKIVYCYLSELFGWVLIFAASVAVSIMYIASIFFSDPSSWTVWFIWLCIWIGMALASFIRSYDLYFAARRSK